MTRIVIELTNRCNLRCHHCFDERHAGSGDLSIDIIDKVLREGKPGGLEHLSFTGGEPTIHREFAEIVRRVCSAEYSFSFVSNGSQFPYVYPLLLEHRRWFNGVTFSLDGARRETHDNLRGEGSFRQVFKAASICVVKDLPFTFNMVLTSRNRHEVGEMVELARQLGSRGLRFGHLMPTSDTAARALDLTPAQRRQTEAEIWRLQKASSLPVGMAPGHYSPSPFFPCGPLELEEFNIDYKGNLTLCCQLSGNSGSARGSDFVGNLFEMSFNEACTRFAQKVSTYLTDKQKRVSRGEFEDLDHFPCWYCQKYLGKVQGLEGIAQHSWMSTKARKSNDHSGTTDTPTS